MIISETIKKEWFVLLILVAPFVASFILWDQIPDVVPTHFNMNGEADDWGPKWVNAIMLPVIGLGVYALLLVLPLIDPKKKITSVQKPIAAIRILTSIFFVGVYAFVMAHTLGVEANMISFVLFASGSFIVILGNYLNSIKPNYFIGVKTPWTLENPEVWRKTHRFTSKLFIVVGICLMIGQFIPVIKNSSYFIIAIIFGMAVIPIIYSYLMYKKLESKK